MLDLYKNIRKLREAKGLSQEELAKLVGYTNRSSIAKIEKGEVDLTQSKIIAFAEALGTTPGELMGLTECDKHSTTVQTIAAHKEGENFTSEELKKIEEYKKLLIAARPKE